MTIRHTSLIRRAAPLALAAAGLSAVASAQIAGQEIEAFNGVEIVQRLEAELPLDARFIDHTGQSVALGDSFDELPVVLTMNYVDCPQLCSMQLTGLATAMGSIGLELGQDYRVVTVSIDPGDTPEKAAGMQSLYVDRYLDASEDAGEARAAGAAVGWTYLVGGKVEIDRVADAVGFGYRWVPEQAEYAHQAATILCTAEGVVARYLPGVVQAEEAPNLLRPALVEAGEGRIGTLWDNVFLNCFIYDPNTGEYTLAATRLLKAAAALTVIAVLTGMFFLRRGEAQRSPNGDAASVRDGERSS